MQAGKQRATQEAGAELDRFNFYLFSLFDWAAHGDIPDIASWSNPGKYRG